ncbi:glycosyltransferase family 9 protein [Chitinilyticum litopenaei]|uniref:glycosyltransferase family 9 protein n=1 Tax=Chitinilyticum litopenaei TaxID=1121276 RepID=UPI00041BBD44|nr:glycosyltransferase family 9 protein [Chitinilyticum litopenaei]
MKRRFLVIIVARYGDSLLATPVLRALKQRYPDCTLDVLAHPKRLEILKGLPEIDRLAGISKRAAQMRGWLLPRQYDTALVYGNDMPLIRFARRVAHDVYAFGREKSTKHLHWITPPAELMPAAQERALLAQALDLSISDWRLGYQVSPQEFSWSDAWLATHHLQSGQIIGLQLQSFPSKAYRDWPIAHFRTLIDLLQQHYPDWPILLLGGPESRELASRLAQQYPNNHVISIAGSYPFRHSAALMARLGLYVGVDTGPTHLAGALQIPMVALYHSAHPGRYLAPQQHPALRVIEHPDHSLNREARMADIPVEDVWKAIQFLMPKGVQ